MADTLPDVYITKDAYVDLFSETGIAVGSALLVQNKTPSAVMIQTGAAQPASNDDNGVLIQPLKFVIVEAGETGAWALGSGFLSVQEN